jgi:hypothetical protein
MYSISFRLPEQVAFLSKKQFKDKNEIYEEFEDESRKKMKKTL